MLLRVHTSYFRYSRMPETPLPETPLVALYCLGFACEAAART